MSTGPALALLLRHLPPELVLLADVDRLVIRTDAGAATLIVADGVLLGPAMRDELDDRMAAFGPDPAVLPLPCSLCAPHAGCDGPC